ncbi:hypothetical protein [Halobacteriovorax sp. HLS]|uniref:hypothetical protein n=1 Tax=Halobacteriovorax sp. HLS TaxID=2234000 RepID=UPI000FDBAA6D|nr:hypothetical protein [Halobacteriovorax sp. HLS]
MANTLEKKSGILFLKSKFFIYRLVSYFSFLLIPVYVQKSLDIRPVYQVFMMLFYSGFIMSQWFFLGKEIDHRLKIYFRVNSSIDRVVYRLFLGLFFFILVFNLVYLLPSKWIYNVFWIIWGVLGLFYSWPTRGKIIQESVTTNFSEFKYLDSFEKTIVSLVVLMVAVTIPALPELVQKEALILYFDPAQHLSPMFWNFLTVTYYPFKNYPTLFKIAWSSYFYVVNICLYLLTFYAFARFFISRRLSLLGVFAIISSWSVSKILVSDYGAILFESYSILWIWGLLWVTKSSTYRTGLFLGLLGFYGALLNQSYALLSILQVLVLIFYFLKDKTDWFKRQLLKYASFGLALMVLVVIFNFSLVADIEPSGIDFISNIKTLIDRKAFYTLSFFGVLIVLLKRTTPRLRSLTALHFDKVRIDEFNIGLFILFSFGIVINGLTLQGFSLLWIIAFFSLIPLEVVFLQISRLRSSRNMIYLIYILICLLDSHFEGRFKIFLKLFHR